MITNIVYPLRIFYSQCGRVFKVLRGSKVSPKFKNGQKKCPIFENGQILGKKPHFFSLSYWNGANPEFLIHYFVMIIFNEYFGNRFRNFFCH
jgi:hypothetical protein